MTRLPEIARQNPLASTVRALLFGAVIGASLAAMFVAMPAHAQTAVEEKAYAIPASSLETVIAQFSAASGVTVSFAPDLAKGRNSAGLDGRFSVERGLAALLAGTGLQAVASGNGGYVLREVPEGAAVTLAPVRVNAEAADDELPRYAGDQIASGGRLGLMGDVAATDAPFNVIGFTAQAVADQQARTVADMVAWDASVRSTAPSGDVADAFFIRGFPIGDNNIGEIAFDGLFGIAPNYRLMADYAERIDILKGPSAAIYGMSPNSGVGGAINVVPKRAQADLLRLRADYATASQVGGHLDAARRYGESREFGIRVNVGQHRGDTPVDHQSRDSTLGALALDYAGERLRVTLDWIDQHEAVDAPSRRPSLRAGLLVPDAPDNETNITQRWEWYESDERSALLRVDYALTTEWALFAGIGTANTEVDRFFNTPMITNALGDTTVTPSRGVFDIERDSAEAGIRGEFSTADVSHSITLQWSGYSDQLSQVTSPGQAYSSNIYSPIAQPEQYVPVPSFVPRRSETRLGGVAVADTLGFLNDSVLLTLGIRRQAIRVHNYDSGGNRVQPSYDKSANSPLVGLVFKPWQHTSIYANYIEGLSKGDTAPSSADNAGEVFAPYETRQREVGVKFGGEESMTTLSLFEIEKPSWQSINNRYAPSGKQRNRGAELSMYGTITEGVRLLGGATWIDAELVNTSNINTKGNQAVGVPEWQLALKAEWDIPGISGLTASVGGRYSGEQFANQLNTQHLSSWTAVDLGARYSIRVFGQPLTMRATLQNAFDRDYWAGASTWGTLIAGEPRTLLLSATIDF